jgi:hypothetical protein
VTIAVWFMGLLSLGDGVPLGAAGRMRIISSREPPSQRTVASRRVHSVTLGLAMDLTPAARSPLAAPRRGLAGVLTAMVLVLLVLGVQAVCGIHLDDAGHGGTSAHGGAAQATVTAPDQVTGAAPGHHGDGHHGEGPNHCAEDRPVTARSDRTVSPSVDLARAPALAVQWLVPEITLHCPQEPAGLAVAEAPSLHALGISRT